MASTTSLLLAELRQLGGALALSAPGGGALSRLDAAYVGFFVGIAATPEMADLGRSDTDRVLAALAPHATGGTYLNMAEHALDPRTGFEASTWERLRKVRAAVDPSGVMLANHPVR